MAGINIWFLIHIFNVQLLYWHLFLNYEITDRFIPSVKIIVNNVLLAKRTNWQTSAVKMTSLPSKDFMKWMRFFLLLSWEIYENNHKTFAIFTINPLNFFLSTLAKHTIFSPNYPSLQTKNNFLSLISSNQRQLFTLESSTNGNGKKQW